MTEPEQDKSASLVARFRRLSTRNAGQLDRWLLLAGAIAVPLGIVLIILGWAGASRTPFVFEQIPYMISGGLLGIALVFGGGFVYFAYWQTRSARETREQQRELLAALDRIAAALGVEGAPATSASIAAASAAPDRLVSTAKGAMFHREDCPVAQRATKLRTVKGTERGLKPCGICNPAPA